MLLTHTKHRMASAIAELLVSVVVIVSARHLISGTLHSTPLPWLPVLSSIEPPALRRNAATDKLVEEIVKHDRWPIQPDILNPPLLRLTSRKPLWLDLQRLTSKVDGGITGSRLRWSILTYCATPQSGNRVSTSIGNSGLCWTIFVRNGDTAVPAEENGDLQTLICVPVARPRRCSTLLKNLSPDKTEW